jgi:hypothetical protein
MALGGVRSCPHGNPQRLARRNKPHWAVDLLPPQRYLPLAFRLHSVTIVLHQSHEYEEVTRIMITNKYYETEVFEMSASEVAELDERAIADYEEMNEFRFSALNSTARAAMLDALAKDYEITGGWYWQECDKYGQSTRDMPGSILHGPFATLALAFTDADEHDAGLAVNPVETAILPTCG